MSGGLTLSTDMMLVLGLVALTMGLFLFDRIRADVVALCLLVLLGLTGLVAPEDLFAGFSGSAVMSIIASMILGAGLERTGALDRLAAQLLRRSRGQESRLITLTSLAAGVCSAVMQNPSVMALFLPVIARLSARTGVATSRLLLPAASAIVMGGALTMVGNSPLILLNDLMLSANANLPSGAATLHPLRMFAPFPIGVALLVLSLVYYRYWGDTRLNVADRGVTPGRTEHYFAQAYGLRGDVHELAVPGHSALVGRTLGEVEAAGAPLLLAHHSHGESRLAPPGDGTISVGDVLGVMGERDAIEDFARHHGLRLSPRLNELDDLFNPARAGISEGVVPPSSTFIGKTPAELQLRKRLGLNLLAVDREREVLRENLRELRLRAGDMLVLHASWQNLSSLVAQKDVVVVTDYPKAERRPKKFGVAMGIFALTMLLALSARIPVPIALMTGVAGMLLTGVIHMDEAYAAINWRTVFLMAGLIPLGWAMDSSGAAAWIAGHTVDRIPQATPLFVIECAVALLTVACSLVIGHVGAVIMLVPIAINVALATGDDPGTLALVVALSASNNFMTVSNPVISMVTGPGDYTQRELWRVGGPLSLLYTLLMVGVLNLIR